MRVQLIRDRDDHGAIAVIVALLAVVLVGLAAFAVDFGNSYAVKRKLSVAADAAALAAASDVGKIALTQATGCSGGLLQPASAQAAAQTVAQTTATAVNSRNDLSGQATVTSVTVTCTSQDVRVNVVNHQTVPTLFGSVFGVSQTDPTRSATARVFSSDTYSGLRPIAACASTVQVRYQPKSGVQQPFLVFMDKNSLGSLTGLDTTCYKASSGQWDVANFLDQGYYNPASGYFSDPCAGGNPQSGGNGKCQAAWLENGYGGAVYLKNPHVYVPDPALRTNAADPGLLGNSGVASSNSFRNALDTLPGKVVLIPVVDWLSNAKIGIKNVNDRFGLTGVVAVRVCATYDEQSGAHVDPSPIAGECGGYITPDASGSPYVAESNWWTNAIDSNNKRYGMWVWPIDYVSQGSVGGPNSTCTIFDNVCTPPVVQLFQ